MQNVPLWLQRAALAATLIFATKYYLSPGGAETATATTGIGTIWLHVIGMAAIGAVTAFTFSGSGQWNTAIVLLFVIGYGALLETGQLAVPARTFTFIDIAANTAGSIVSVPTTHWFKDQITTTG